MPADEQARCKLDRVWRFRWLRGLTFETLRSRLTDRAAIAAYQDDPFNPHAIARVRPTAYQKSIVMQTVDNYLDWGDSLFARDTREALAEAQQIYTIAAEILGPRPQEIGDCVDETTLSYADIAAEATLRFPFLAELESQAEGAGSDHRDTHKLVSRKEAISTKRKTILLEEDEETPEPPSPVVSAGPRPKNPVAVGKEGEIKGAGPLNDWAASVIHQIGPVFCVPVNEQLLARWDRLEDRLFKLRNCLRLDGTPRSTAPFAPPIDPTALVRARASGMPVGDLAALAAPIVPPYRFQALIGRARQYASSVQRLGAALASALERRDAEELAVLRQSQALEITRLTNEIRQRELETADLAITTLERQRDAVEYRRSHYEGLLREGNLEAESTARTLRELSLFTRVSASLFHNLAGLQRLTPQFAAWILTLFGGQQLGGSTTSIADGMNTAAGAIDLFAVMAETQARHQRRTQDWKHQRDLADKELATLAPQLDAARLRRRIAERSALIHDKGLEHIDEVLTFFDEKATNTALYTVLVKALRTLHRRAYDAALTFARLAEAAWRFERDVAEEPIGNHWNAREGGLLAGDGLMLDLERLERRFVETHDRTPEINQNFSLARIDPGALLTLRKAGACAFSLPAHAFDLHYPGHFRRRMKGVRLTIACTGEITTNISARLSLTASRMRLTADAAAPLTQLPLSGSTTIATSTGEGDGGVFVFDFNGERYMPFEGMGAISEWHLALPSRLRPFDYGAISDVVLNMSYVARDDAGLRAALDGDGPESLLATLDHGPFAFSLKEHAASAFYTLIDGDGAPVTVQIEKHHLPAYLRKEALTVQTAALVLDTDVEFTSAPLPTITVGVTSTDVQTVGDPPRWGGMPAADWGAAPPAEIEDAVADSTALTLALDANGAAAWNADAIRDIVILLTLTIVA